MSFDNKLRGYLAGALLLVSTVSCGGQQQPQAKLETRPLEEAKAHEIIVSVLTGRNYAVTTKAEIQLATKAVFPCDFRVVGEKIAIEYVTAQDRIAIGQIPPAAQGSRLHVLPASAVPEDPAAQGEPVYVFFIDDGLYEYQYNPTSQNRADVTFGEVESRLRRDLADFLSWHENSGNRSK